MQRRIGYAEVDSIAAESPKFTASIVLIHGLWCTAAVWRGFMGYFAHRGWSCYAVNLRGRAGRDSGGVIGAVRCVDYLDDVRGVIAACAAPPVVLGHDLGALLALHGGAPEVRAVVALAPLVPRTLAAERNRLFTGLRSRFAIARGRPLPPPRGNRGARCFAHGVPGGTQPDSSCVPRELDCADFDLRTPSAVPALVLAGERDLVCPPDHARRLADRVGAAFRCVAGAGHALPWDVGWEGHVSEIHRWLIQTLGEDLLAMREDEAE